MARDIDPEAYIAPEERRTRKGTTVRPADYIKPNEQDGGSGLTASPTHAPRADARAFA